MKKNFRFLAMAVVAMAAAVQCSRDVHPTMTSLLRMRRVRFKPAR